jgi:hypothetical protein
MSVLFENPSLKPSISLPCWLFSAVDLYRYIDLVCGWSSFREHVMAVDILVC